VGASDDDFIAWLGDAPATAELGGKGASLDRLIRLGFRVPPAFCLTTRAFEAQRRALTGDAAAAGNAAIAAPLELATAARSQLATAAGPELASAALVPAIAGPLEAALERLTAELAAAEIFSPRFAVRSSAVGEDGSQASFAGLHDTELDLAADAVPGAVARCWASLWSPAALAYRTRRGLAADEASMAVIVQALVPAEAAAVVFTRHPVTGREDQLVLTAVRGFGDAMVSGTVTPDTYVIDKASRQTLDLEPGEDPRGPALDGEALAELVDLALAVEARFGVAADIEAAFAAGAWFLLQARPITTGVPA
jgi:phosphoenolpyruvate synthase/pyruvate phosphate dikinase